MTPDETIEYKIRCFPSLYRNRSQCLDSLFFTGTKAGVPHLVQGE